MTKWYERRPFCELMIDRCSLYSVIIASSADDEASSGSPEHENSKIALPARESATIAYRATSLFISGYGDWNYRGRTTVWIPAAVPQVTV